MSRKEPVSTQQTGRRRWTPSAARRCLGAVAALSLLLISASTSHHTSSNLPTVKGAFGVKPSLAVPSGVSPQKTLQVQVVQQGDGPKLAAGQHLVANYVGQTWRTGNVFDSTWDRGKPELIPLGVAYSIPGWDEGLQGQSVGSRVMIVIPPNKGFGTTGRSALGIHPDDTLIYLFDILGAIPQDAKATGKAARQDARAPQVSDKPAEPSVSIPSGVAPAKDLTAFTIINGAGSAVGQKQVLVLHYVAVNWRTGNTIESTWARGHPTVMRIGDDQALGGWTEQLVGTNVGSRILVEIPPQARQSSVQPPGVQPNDQIVYVIDILASY